MGTMVHCGNCSPGSLSEYSCGSPLCGRLMSRSLVWPCLPESSLSLAYSCLSCPPPTMSPTTDIKPRLPCTALWCLVREAQKIHPLLCGQTAHIPCLSEHIPGWSRKMSLRRKSLRRASEFSIPSTSEFQKLSRFNSS